MNNKDQISKLDALMAEFNRKMDVRDKLLDSIISDFRECKEMLSDTETVLIEINARLSAQIELQNK